MIFKQFIFPGAALFTAVLLPIILSKRRQRSRVDSLISEEDDKQIIAKQFQQLQQTRKQLIKISGSIKISYVSQRIMTKSSLFTFCKQAAKTITERQVWELYEFSRKNRRRHFQLLGNDLHETQEYFKCVCAFDNEIQFLIDKSQKDLAVFVDVDYNIISQTIDYYLDKEKNQFRNELSECSVELRESLKKKLKPKADAQFQLIKQVVEYQIEVLTTQKQFVIEVIQKLKLQEEDQSFVPSFIYLYVFDKINDKFNLQQEDIISKSYTLMANQEGKELSRQCAAAQNRMVSEIINIL